MEGLKFFGLMCAVQFARYILITGGAYYFFWVRDHPKKLTRKIQDKDFTPAQIRREIFYSVLTAFIFALILSLIFNPAIMPLTKVYHGSNASNFIWTILSLPVLMVVHDTYFYWMHRFLHHPWVFRHVHRVHHESKNPSPWAAYAFHPFEAILEVIWIAPVVFLIPLNYGVLFLFSIVSLGMNVIGHLGLELYPPHHETHFFLRHFNTATLHNEHHRLNKNHYGLYFNWWDRLLKTTARHATSAALLACVMLTTGCGVYSSMRPADTLKQGELELTAGGSTNMYGLWAFVGNAAVGLTNRLEATAHYETYSALGGLRLGLLKSETSPIALALGFESGVVSKPEVESFDEKNNPMVVFVPNLSLGRKFSPSFGQYELYGTCKVFFNGDGYELSAGKLGNRFVFKDKYFVGIEAGASLHRLNAKNYWWVGEGGAYTGVRFN